MELSIFLAKIIGLVLTLISGALLINKKNVDLLFSIYNNTKTIFITGILETALGIALILGHNIWTFDFRGIITFIGWMLLLRGLGRVFFPAKTVKLLEKFKKSKSLMTPLLVFIFLVGVYLAWKGFVR